MAREKARIFTEMCNGSWRDELSFGDTLKINNISNLTTQTKNRSANAATLFETVTETASTFTVATWVYSAIAIESATAKQVLIDLLGAYAPKQGYALALALDSAINANVASITNAVGTLNIELVFDDMVRGDQYLNDADAPQEDRAIGISPAQKAGFLKLDQFVNADYDALNADVDARAFDKSTLGTWMGYPVHISTNVNGSNAAGHDNVMMQKEAISFIEQMTPTMHGFFDVNYLADKRVVEELYGTLITRNDHAVYLKGA